MEYFLTNLIDDVAALVATVSAIILSFKGRSSWEPVESDLAKGPQKLGLLVAATGIVFTYSSGNDIELIKNIAIWSIAICLVSFILYGVLITMYTYVQEISVGEQSVDKIKVIGGLWIHSSVTKEMKEGSFREQVAFKKAAYQKDEIWPRFSQAIAKIGFYLSYIMVVSAGATTLVALVILLQASQFNE